MSSMGGKVKEAAKDKIQHVGLMDTSCFQWYLFTYIRELARTKNK
jgi:hypothetical protein